LKAAETMVQEEVLTDSFVLWRITTR
jgi:hypothetical protein